MKLFVVLCLVAAACGKPSEFLRPANPSIESMLRPNFDDPEPEANINDITRPSAIPQLPEVIEVPAGVSPLVQIIINLVNFEKESIPVGTFPLIPEEGPELPPVGTFPLFPGVEEPELNPLPFPFPEDLPNVGTYPLIPDMTRPAQPGVNPEFLRPSVNDQVEDLPLNNFNENAERPTVDLIRRH